MSIRTTKITRAYLANHLACTDQRNAFDSLFPEGVEVTEELALQHAETFDWDWAIENLLEGDVRREAGSKGDDAYRDRQKARDEINAAYNRKSSHTTDEVRARLEAIGETKRVYQLKLAAIFARAFLQQDGRAVLESEGAGGMTLTITEGYLDHLYACPAQLRKFVSLFPEGVTVTEELAVKHAEDFEWTWAIYTLLMGEHKTEAKEALEAAEAHYRRTVKPTYEAYVADLNNLVKRANYDRLAEAAHKNLHVELAVVFAHYFIKQGGRPLLMGESPC